MIYQTRGRHCIAKLSLHYFTTFVHLCQTTFAFTNFSECSGLNISGVFIFANERDFMSKYIQKSGSTFTLHI